MNHRYANHIKLRYILFLILFGFVALSPYIGSFLLENTIFKLVDLYFQVKLFISSINDATNPWSEYLLIIITCLFIAFVFLFSPPYPNWLRCSVIVVTFLLHTVYMTFRITILNLHGPLNTISSCVLYMVEAFHYMMMCCFYLQMAWGSDRSRLADRGERLVVSGQYNPTVAFFVPTLNEPVNVLRRTLVGCMAVDYEPKTVYLLDDGARNKMRELANELGVQYIARKDRTGAKAGNLNNALLQTDEELVAFLDCDNIPAKDFLRRMVGMFHDPTVALVISSLHYFNAQEQKKIIGVEMLTAADHANSLGYSQTGRDYFNALLCFGTSYLIRRSALDLVGGIPTETLCEDWATSIRLQNKKYGFKTYFVNEVLSTGLAAENMQGFVKQRLRWCQGTIQSLYSSTNPLTAEGLSRCQRLVHFYGVLYYLVYPMIFISWFIPLIYFFFGILPLEANIQQFACFFFPFFVMLNAMYVVFARRLSALVSSQIYDFVMCWPFTVVALKSLIMPFGKRFEVTRKGIRSDCAKPLPSLSLPLLIMFLLYLSAIIYGFHNMKWSGASSPFMVYAVWAVYRMVFLWLAYNAAVNLPQKRKSVRFCHQLSCKLFSLDGRFLSKADIINLSEDGAQIFSENANIPKRFQLSIPDLALYNIHATIIRSLPDSGMFGIAFQGCSRAIQHNLIERLYCEPGQWDSSYLPEKTALGAILKFFSIFK